ncbi:unnamed protein product [Larinioides sclopetarius]|uniref:Oligomycin sensitivity conferral protein n=1 Tax=Larinioides sclopetarius TaxID=280406 RepID=A0AAV2BP01_9ARAC
MSGSKTILTLTRQFSSTSVKSSAMIKPPVPVFGIAGRYATALYSAAMKEKKMDAVEKDVKDLNVVMAKDKKLAEFVLNPLLKVNIKIDTLKKIFAKKNYSPLTLNLLVTMAENRRLKSLTSVLDCFTGIMSTIRGEIVCEVVTAKAPGCPYFSRVRESFEIICEEK